MGDVGDVDRMRRILAENPNIKYGFVVFRCVYGNDKAWAKFMWHVNERVRRALKEEGAEELFERIDWCVQDHPRLCFADEGNVRRLFQRWMRETDEEDYWTGTSRFMACVVVTKFDLMSVLKGPPPHKFDTIAEQHVTLVSANRKEGSTWVCLSSLVPRVYSLLDGCGWDNFAEEDDVARP